MEPSHNWWYFVKITCRDVISIVCCTQTKLEFLSIAENVKVPFLLYKVLSGNLPFITSSFVMYYVHTRCHNHMPGFGALYMVHTRFPFQSRSVSPNVHHRCQN